MIRMFCVAMAACSCREYLKCEGFGPRPSSRHRNAIRLRRRTQSGSRRRTGSPRNRGSALRAWRFSDASNAVIGCA
jgi:hypothetical protein